MRAEELQTVREQCAYSSAESGLYRTILHKGGYIKVRTKEFPHSAAGLTVSVGRDDYKGYKLFCNGFFHGCLRDCRVKPDNDNYLFVIPRFSSFPRHIQAFLPLVIPVLPLSKSSPGKRSTTRGSLRLPGQARQ